MSEFFHYTSKKAFDLLTSEPGRWMPSMALGFDANYGPGWYVTVLPPQTPDDVLLEALWNGDQSQKHKTEYWLKVLVTETYKGFKRPDPARADVVFIPYYNRGMQGEPPKPTGVMSRILLLEAGRRNETGAGQVTVSKLFKPEADFPLVENRMALEEGYPILARHRLMFHNLADYPDLEEFEVGLVDESDALFKAGEFAKALAVVDMLLASVPESVLGLSNKGAILAKLGKREQALAFYNRALGIDPKHVSTLVNKAGNLVKLERHKEALTVCDRALAIDPSNAESMNNKGIALANLGQDDQAYACFKRATDLAPEIAEAWNGLGGVLGNRAMQSMRRFVGSRQLDALSDLKASARSFLKALEVRPTYRSAQQNLRKSVHDIIALLPSTWACEPEIFEASLLDPEIASELTRKLFADHAVGLHPRYLAEINMNGLNRDLKDQKKFISSVARAILLALEQGWNTLTAAIQESHFRLGLHCLNEALVHLGLIQFTAKVDFELAALPLATGEQLQVAKSLGETGIGFRKVHEWDNALKCYEKAFSMYKQCGDRKFCGHMLYNCGAVFGLRKDEDDINLAQRAFRGALQIYIDLGMKEDEAATRQRLSELSTDADGKSFLKPTRRWLRFWQ